MILRIDHVGLATDDPAGVATALTALGLTERDAGVAPDYGVACGFWSVELAGAGSGPPPAVEVVSPTRPDSSISNRLATSGPGLYHLAVEVDDLAGELKRLRGHGFLPVDAEPCAGARPGMRVAFLYLPKPAALLVELVHYSRRQP